VLTTFLPLCRSSHPQLENNGAVRFAITQGAAVFVFTEEIAIFTVFFEKTELSEQKIY